jgi:uncharacterized protein (DUF2236 family)
VRGIHRQLRIKDPSSGRLHRVDDPELLLWVHCAEISSYLAVARRGGLGLTERLADQYIYEQRKSATYVGLHLSDVPGSLSEMNAYFRRMRPALRVTSEAASAVRFLLWPQLPPSMRFLSPGKPLYFPFGALCYYTLPRWARQLYGLLPEVPRPAVTAALWGFRLAMNSLPESVHDRAFMPATRTMLIDSRTRLAAAGYDTSKGHKGLTDPRRWPTGVYRHQSQT